MALRDGTVKKCPICGEPYRVYMHTAADQSACPECQRKADKNMGVRKCNSNNWEHH